MKMKYTLLAAIAVLAFSCSKKDQPVDPATKGTLSATLSGAAVFGTTYQSTIPVSQFATRANQQFEIVAYAVNGKDTVQMDLLFPDTLSLNKPFNDPYGTQFMLQIFRRDPTANFSSYYCKVPSTTVTITSLDRVAKKIVGTFSGKIALVTASDSITVTNGTFNTIYKTYPQ